MPSPAIVILGPQRHRPTLLPSMEKVGVRGPVAAVTVGWEEREGEVERLEAHLGAPVINLELHRRSEDIVESDPEFTEAWLVRKDRLREMGEIYRHRLSHLLRAVRELLRRREDDDLLDPEREAAIDDVRRLDDFRVRRLEEFHAEFEERWRVGERDSVAGHRREVASLVEDAAAVAVAGGNVAVLLNRMRVFGLPDLMREKPIFAWSAGAMALTERVVLFHDDPPIAVGNAEVMGPGLGLGRGVVARPHPPRRPRLGDRGGGGGCARRFAPALCLAMEDGCAMALRGRKRTVLEEGFSVLEPSGAVVPWGAR